MNDIVKTTGGVPANPEDLLGGLQNIKKSLKSGNMPYLRLLKDGVFVYGSENSEVEPGSLWALNPYSLMHGFACWNSDENTLIDEVMVPMNEQLPLLSSLPDTGHDWRRQASATLQCVSGEDQGLSVEYKGTSKGLSDAVTNIAGAIIEQVKAGEPFVPVVALESDHYMHKKWGRTYTPALNIDHWVDMDGLEAVETEDEYEDEYEDDGIEDGELIEEAEEAEEVEEKPKRKKKKKAKKSAAKPAGKKPVKKKGVKKAPASQTRRRRAAE